METFAAGDALRTSRVADRFRLLVRHDTLLDPDGVARLLDCARRVARYETLPAVIVGATRCPRTGGMAAGGLNRKARRSRRFIRVTPSIAPLPVDTFDPACFLVPDAVAGAVGDRPWSPSLGLRLHKMGFVVFLAPGYVGVTSSAPAVVASAAAI